MLKNNIAKIGYARISTNNTAQLSSLGNQYKRLEKHGKVITHIGTGGNEFPDEFKNEVMKLCDQNKDVQINIVSFDRLTRNFRDLDFIKKNIRYINVLDENQIYDTKIHMNQIVINVLEAVQELDRIQKRCGRRRGGSVSSNLSSNPRKLKTRKELSENTEKRCRSVSSNLEICGIHGSKLNNLEKLVIISQNLSSLDKWTEMFSLMKKLGLKDNEAKQDYKNITDKYNNSKYKEIYRIPKSDLYQYVRQIMRINKFKNDENFINNFINAYMRKNTSS